MERMIPYGHQHITEDDIQAVVDSLRSECITQGSVIEDFEVAFAEYVGSKYAVAVSNGTAALHLSALVLDVSPGDNVIVPPITFAASANCVRYCGGNVVFCDINEKNYLLDLDKLKNLLDSKPKGHFKGVIPVDYAGYPIDGEKLKEIADEYNLYIIEDACHAPGAYFVDSKGDKQLTGNGRFADLTCFSFHPVKHITTGEGGMITTNSKALYERLLVLRTHGICKDPNKLEANHGGWYYEMQELGFNYRLTSFQAALGLSQLKRAVQGVNNRQKIAERYNKAFNDSRCVKLSTVSSKINHSYHLYVVQVEERKGLYDFLRKNGIFVQVHYEPVHLQPYYRSFGHTKGEMPVSEKFYEHCLSLPMYPTLSIFDQEYVIKKVQEFFTF